MDVTFNEEFLRGLEGLNLSYFRKIHSSALPVFIVLCGFLENGKDAVSISLKDLSKYTGLSKRTVYNALSALDGVLIDKVGKTSTRGNAVFIIRASKHTKV